MEPDAESAADLSVVSSSKNDFDLSYFLVMVGNALASSAAGKSYEGTACSASVLALASLTLSFSKRALAV